MGKEDEMLAELRKVRGAVEKAPNAFVLGFWLGTLVQALAKYSLMPLISLAVLG